MRLICFPHAGAGRSAYRKWPSLLPEVDIIAMLPRGRESRFREPALGSVAAILDDLLTDLQRAAAAPFALFGHSMGALLAYEAAVRLQATGRPPEHLIVSGRPAPDWSSPDPPLHLFPDDAFAAELKRYNGAAEELWENEELLALVLPTLRADFRACETYRPSPAEPLVCPITALAGQDDPDTARAGTEGWAQYTSAAFTAITLSGDHFFIDSNRAAALDVIRFALMQHGRTDRAADCRSAHYST